MKTGKYIAFAFGVLLATATSCTDECPDFGKDSLVPEGQGEMKKMSVEKQLAFLGETAAMGLSYFNPEDQKTLILNAIYAEMAYGELKAPAEWRELAGKTFDFNPMEWIKGIAGAEGSAMKMTKVSFNIVKSLYFKDFSGVYTPGNGEWIKSSESNNIEFQFPGADGQVQTFTISASDKTFLYSYVGEEWKGSDIYYTSTALYLPTEITASYNVHGISLADCNISYSVDPKKNGSYDIEADVTANAANLSTKLRLTATEKRLSAEYALYINGQQLSNGAIVAHGKNLTNLQHIMLLTKVKDVAMLVKNGEAYVDILGRVQINSAFSMTDRFFDHRPILTPLDNVTKEEAEKEVKKAADVYNRYTKVWMRFNDTRTKQATLHWTTRTTDLPEGWTCSMYPQIHFPADNSTYDLDTLIETGFSDAAQGILQLIEAYKAALGL